MADCWVYSPSTMKINYSGDVASTHLKGITKFWEISKNGWIVILYNFDIF